MSPTRETPSRTGEKASPARCGNDDVAEQVPAATAPAAGAIAEKEMPLPSAVEQLVEKDAEIADLKAQVDKPK